jgi:hypothetical protein
MNGQVPFTLRGRNPDVLTCIANLSNDEVFTPPDQKGRTRSKGSDSIETWINYQNIIKRLWPFWFPQHRRR